MPLPSSKLTRPMVMAMVAAGLAQTITALCPAGAGVTAANCRLPLPGVPLSRTIYQLSREGEYEDMAIWFSDQPQRA